jgi:hypothetical protein
MKKWRIFVWFTLKDLYSFTITAANKPIQGDDGILHVNRYTEIDFGDYLIDDIVEEEEE